LEHFDVSGVAGATVKDSGKQKKVVHIITGLNDGGAEGALYRLCCADKNTQHTVISIMGQGKYGPLLAVEGVSVVTLDMAQGRVTLKGIFKLWRTLRRLKPDVVQTWLYHADLIGGVIARLAGVRRVFWGIRHSNLTPGTVKRSTIIIAKICARLSKVVPYKIISCSKEGVRAHTAIGYSPDRFLVIPNGYDLAKFQPQLRTASEVRRALSVPKNKIVLGMVGRFDPQKDHYNLLNALSTLDFEFNVVCLLVGTGMDESNANLMQLIQQADCSARVQLLGRRTDIPAIMSMLDIHVLSSLGEAFPNVLAEAMACGTPCITTDVGNAALIVGDTGWVVAPQDSALLSDALRTAIRAKDNEESWRKRCLAAQKRIEENFSIETMVNSYHAAWEA
jgi:glycosyltransferase involved in cell wall biosynthesis